MVNTNQHYNLSIYLIDSNGNEFNISSENVASLTMTESVLSVLPKFEMTIVNAGTFMENTPLTDKMQIRIVLESINRTVENLNTNGNDYIDATFIISSYYVIPDPSENKYFLFKLAGYLSYPYSPIKFFAYKGSSDQVIEQIANKSGFNLDIRTRGGESMSWIQNNNSLNFLYHICERAYISGDGVFVYSTLNRNLIYTSLYTEYSKESSKIAIYDRNKEIAFRDKVTMAYDGYNIANNTSIYNNTLLYGYQYIYFDGEKTVTQTIKPNEKITELSNRNILFPENSFANFEDYGLIGDENLQNTIFRGKIQNDYFKHLLFSNTVELNISTASDVSLFEKVSLDLKSTISPNTISEPYSGDYVVGAITHSITKNIPYSKKIILCRHGINDYDSPYVKDIV